MWRTTPTGTGSIATEIHRDRLPSSIRASRRPPKCVGSVRAGETASTLGCGGPSSSGALPSRSRTLLGDKSKILKMRGSPSCSGPTTGASSRAGPARFDLLATYGIGIIDADESLDRFESTPTGVPDTLDRLTSALAAAAGIPRRSLFGEAPAGLNATGDSDVRNFYDRLAADRTSKIVPSSSVSRS